jgi:hypothetical protein
LMEIQAVRFSVDETIWSESVSVRALDNKTIRDPLR